MYLKDVPQEVAQAQTYPFTIFSLLQHEHKKSVLNFTVQRNTEYDGSVRSKVIMFLSVRLRQVLNFVLQDPLILCVGPRRLRVNPVYSQHSRGGGKGSNNVHKFERFLRHGGTSVATVYGPVVFGSQPCMLLRETDNSQGRSSYKSYHPFTLTSYEAPEIVAMGTFKDTDTTRIIAKRIILSGHPFKVHRKTATVRYMFFNAGEYSFDLSITAIID